MRMIVLDRFLDQFTIIHFLHSMFFCATCYILNFYSIFVEIHSLNSPIPYPLKFLATFTVYVTTIFFVNEFSIQEYDHVDIICKKPPLRNQPRIAAYKLEARTQYFIICEQKVLCEVSNFDTALFIVFSSYCFFNLEYPLKTKNLLSFFQDYILEQPDHLRSQLAT